MTRIRHYRFLTIALALCLAGAVAPSTLMALGTPSFAGYAKSHKKHKKHKTSAKKTAAKNEMVKKESTKTEMAKKKTEHQWNHEKKSGKKMESKAKTHAMSHSNMMGQTPPRAGMVWVNTNTRVYHASGSKYYGKTTHGKWMTAADANKAGYKAAKN